jgi:DNA-binding XRE family transcriptional regulator
MSRNRQPKYTKVAPPPNLTNEPRVDVCKLIAARRKFYPRQIDLAVALGVTKNCISSWELGTRSPNASMLMRLSYLLHVDIMELMEDPSSYAFGNEASGVASA